MPQYQKAPRVFLCHLHQDRNRIHDLWSRLKKDGINAWLDRENLLPGQDWEQEIRKTILKSDAVLVCLSRRFNNSRGFRHEEVRIALQKAQSLDGRVFLIPVRLETCRMPESLKHLHRVDLFEKGGYKKLLYTLHELDKQNG